MDLTNPYKKMARYRKLSPNCEIQVSFRLINNSVVQFPSEETSIICLMAMMSIL
jgi:hypothetical protein